jgi:nicotinamidase-related amidase
MILNATSAQIVIVDMQERLVPAMNDGETAVDRCAVILQTAAELSIPVLLSEQYPKGLGATVPRLLELRGQATLLEKIHFSCADDPAMMAHIKAGAALGRRQILLAGIEAHVCVLQSAFGFQAMGLDVFVVADATASRNPESARLAHERLRQSGMSILNTEMAVFECLRKSGTPAFKALSKLIK